MISACEKNHENLAKLLLRSGAIVCSTTKERLTPLHEAARNRNLTLCRLLVHAGAKIWAKSRHGVEPLLTAAQGGCPKVVNLLIANGELFSPSLVRL